MTIAILMGVSGCGKTTVGKAVGAQLGWAFYDADEFHSAASIAKMRAGQPLTDADRAVWLESLAGLISAAEARSEPIVLACSALKKAYRAQLKQAGPSAKFFYLHGSKSLLRQRLSERQGHFAGPSLLASQLATLEPPDDALWIDIAQQPAAIVRQICDALTRLPGA